MDKVDTLENELVELAGPLGKFVVRKQLKEMKLDRVQISDGKLMELAKASVAVAIFDPAKQEQAMKVLQKKLVW